MYNFKNKSIVDIYKMFDGAELEPSDIQNIMNDYTSYIEVMGSKCSSVLEFLIENEEKINKEKMVYILTQKAKEELTKKSKLVNLQEFERNKKRYEKGLKLLKGSRIEVPIISISKGKSDIIDVKTAADLSDSSKKRTENEILQKIDNPDIEKDIIMFGVLSGFDDFICNSPEIANTFTYVMRHNCVMQCKDGSNDEKIVFFNKKIKEYISKYPAQFNMDKLLLIASYRMINALEYTPEALSEEEKKEFVECLEFCNNNISKRNTSIYGKTRTNIFNEETKNIRYSVSDLEKDLLKIVNGRYYNEQEIQVIKDLILNNQMKLQELPTHTFFQLLELSIDEKKMLKSNLDNFEYLININQFNENEVRDIIQNKKGLKLGNMTIIDSLYSRGFINRDDFVSMYVRNNINLSRMLEIYEEYNLDSEINAEKLMEYYGKSEENPENAVDFERYSLLFREVRMKGKSEEEQDEVTEQIMEELCKEEREYSEDLKKLYKSNLLPIKTLIEWNGEQMIYDLVKNNTLKPQDAKDLFKSGQLDLKKTRDSLRKSGLSEVEKINFIFGSFDGSGETEEEIKAQTDARMYLMQSLKMSGDLSNNNKDNIHKTEKGDLDSPVKRKRYIADPVYRWKLMSTIDSDYTQDVYEDGTVIFCLPNVNNGTVIIEKMYKFTGDEVKMNYGSATYVMSQEEFYNHKDSIIQNNKINRKVLIEMKESANKLIHSPSWGKSLKGNLNISKENGYSEEKINEIDCLIEKVQESRTLMD